MELIETEASRRNTKLKGTFYICNPFDEDQALQVDKIQLNVDTARDA